MSWRWRPVFAVASCSPCGGMTSTSRLGNFMFAGAMQRVDGKLQTVELKTASSQRTVVLPRLAVRHLQEHKKRQDAERLALGDAWREHGLVFASTIGTPVEPRNVNRRWHELQRKAGLDWLRLHDLRHGCATFLLAQGVPARAIMEVLGHAEIGVTMNT
jgi:integrase